MRTWYMQRASFVLAALASLVLSGVTHAEQPAAGEGGAQNGFLTVTSVPQAKVFVDDHDSGRTTPVENLSVPAGDHKLTLVAIKGDLKRTLGFKITAGQTTRLKITL